MKRRSKTDIRREVSDNRALIAAMLSEGMSRSEIWAELTQNGTITCSRASFYRAFAKIFESAGALDAGMAIRIVEIEKRLKALEEQIGGHPNLKRDAIPPETRTARLGNSAPYEPPDIFNPSVSERLGRAKKSISARDAEPPPEVTDEKLAFEKLKQSVARAGKEKPE